jgi:hypothetical protein
MTETYTYEEKVEPPKKKKPSNISATPEDEETPKTEPTEEEEKKPEEPKFVTKKRTHSYPLFKISKSFTGSNSLSREQQSIAKERLRWYDKKDEDKIKTDKSKNDLESVIYAMRDWYNEDGNIPFVGSENIDEALRNLSDEEAWLLDGDGDLASTTYVEYNQRYSQLNKNFTQFK